MTRLIGEFMKVLLASVLVCCSIAAYADTENNTGNMPVDNQESNVGKFNIVLAAGLTFGGDELATTTAGQSMSAGGLIYLAAGGVYHLNSSVDIQASIGLHFDALNATDGTAEFTRTFFEIMPFYVMDNGNRLGVGFTQVMSPEYSDPYETVSFEDTSGMIIEYDWQLAPKYFIGARYADLAYDDTNGVYLPVDGSYIGVVMQGHF